MYSICKLPNEVVLQIFKHLSGEKVQELIRYYKGIESASPLLILLYQRLFGGVLLIQNGAPRVDSAGDYLLTIDAFEDKILNDGSFEGTMFENVRPNLVEFKFTRQTADYQRFISDLNSLLQLLESDNPKLRRYFEHAQQINFHLDAHLVFIENPDTLNSIIIKLLLELSRHNLTKKINKFTIKSSEIGSLYVAHWSKLFQYFSSLNTLDLSENLIRSNHEHFLDVWGMSKKFPSTLTTLNMNNNMLTYISKDFIHNLPPSLEVLLMNQNDVEIIEPCDLHGALPKLRNWSLNYTKLCVLSPSLVTKASRGNVIWPSATRLSRQCFNSARHSLVLNHIRLNSTTAKQGPPPHQQEQNGQAVPPPEGSPKGNKPPRSTLFKDLVKLIKLAKPESKLIFFALLCLATSSATTMSLPLIIGKIIDTAKPLDDEDEESDDADPKTTTEDKQLIFGLPPARFYSALAIVFVIGSSANFGRIYLLRTVGEKLVARLRSRLFSKILAQDAYFFDIGPTKVGMKTGDLISRIASDTQIISKSLSMNISDGMRSIISGVVGVSMMCYVSWKLTLCMSLLFPPLIAMSFFYGRRIKALSRLIQENIGALTKVTEEKLNGVKVIQSFAQQQSVVHGYNKEIKNIFNSSLREGKLSGIYFSVNGFLGNITMIGLLVIGTKLIGMGELTIGDLSSFMMYAVYTGSSVFGLGNFYTELMKGLGAAERVFELVEYQPKISNNIGKKLQLKGDIIIKDVDFKYPSRSDVVIFEKLNLHIKEGENLCLVGPSGSGKSTISQLLLRYYDPDSGQIIVGDESLTDIKDLNLNDYRRQIGYVQQEPLLFSGTVKENVTFGKQDATEEEIDRALELSHSLAFVKSLPDGLDTRIGASTSTQLSGGQKQRISLARTLIKEPKILILDEATSALDSISEEEVMKNLSGLNRKKGITIISIAHRLSTIKNSDRVVVFNENGEIVEDGDFHTLHNDQNSHFNRLLKSSKLE
ncbi:MDL1 [Candida theae]|uniref:MDL1 n=1 Tax=Candida theae TaxID=1198502 RepID=A0AAD5BAK1_9ASCO|nr:MDL1 [Candida theae]KAI5948769.1 MDL1 [Candida theae]